MSRLLYAKPLPVLYHLKPTGPSIDGISWGRLSESDFGEFQNLPLVAFSQRKVSERFSVKVYLRELEESHKISN
jgi:hypothetical protein